MPKLLLFRRNKIPNDVVLILFPATAAAAKQRDAENVHASGPAPGPQHTGRRDHVQRDRVRPGGRRVPQSDQTYSADRHRVPAVLVLRVHRTVHGLKRNRTGRRTAVHIIITIIHSRIGVLLLLLLFLLLVLHLLLLLLLLRLRTSTSFITFVTFSASLGEIWLNINFYQLYR